MYVRLCEILIFGPLIPVLMDQSYFMAVIPSQPKRDEKGFNFLFKNVIQRRVIKGLLKLMQLNIL
jgi:hypothetical protein